MQLESTAPSAIGESLPPAGDGHPVDAGDDGNSTDNTEDDEEHTVTDQAALNSDDSETKLSAGVDALTKSAAMISQKRKRDDNVHTGSNKGVRIGSGKKVQTGSQMPAFVEKIYLSVTNREHDTHHSSANLPQNPPNTSAPQDL